MSTLESSLSWWKRSWPADQDIWVAWKSHGGNVAGRNTFIFHLLLTVNLGWCCCYFVSWSFRNWPMLYLVLEVSDWALALKCRGLSWQWQLFFWQGVTTLPSYILFKTFPAVPMCHVFTAANDDLLALIEKTLQLNPLKRCTASEVSVSHAFYHLIIRSIS